MTALALSAPFAHRASSALPIRPFKPSFQKAVEHIQQDVRDEVRWQEQAREDGVVLRPHAESIFLPQAEGQAKGTVVLLHGYTAGPWQYEEMAEQLHDSGFNVYARRMPGHGLAEADGKPSSKDIPASTEGKVWNQFVDETFNDAAALGAPVYAVGLSGGGNVALSMADRHKEVAGVTAMAPFLGGDGLKGALLPVLNVVDMVTFGLFGRLLDAIPRKEKPAPENDPTPRTQGTWGQSLEMYQVGKRVKGLAQPLQLITTENDFLSGTSAHKRLLSRSGPTEKNGWYHFPAEDKVRHAMLSPKENTNAASVATVQGIVSDFLSNGQLAQQRPS